MRVSIEVESSRDPAARVGTASERPAFGSGGVVTRAMTRAERSGDSTACVVKRLGLWEAVTWSQLAGRAAELASGLSQRGLHPSDAVIVALPVSPTWLALDLALETLGARVIFVPPDAIEQLPGSARTARLCIVSDDQAARQVARLLSASGQVPIATPDSLAGRAGVDGGTSRDGLTRWHDLMRGRSSDTSVRSFVSDHEDPELELRAPDIAELWRVIASGRVVPDAAGRTVAISSRASLANWISAVLLPAEAGCVAHFPHWGEDPGERLREVAPTIFVADADTWAALAREVEASLATADWIKRGLRGAIRRLSVRIEPVGMLIQRPLTGHLGLAGVTLAITAPGVASAALLKQLKEWGIDLRSVGRRQEGRAAS